jgi:hypothetical protein
MEIFRDAGIADEINAKATDAQNMQAMPWYAGLARPQDGYGREIGRLEAWDGGYTDPDYIAASATRSGPSSPRARTNCSTLSRPISCARCSTESLPPRLLRRKNSYPNDFTTE